MIYIISKAHVKLLIYYLKTLADSRDGLQACMCSEGATFSYQKENIFAYIIYSVEHMETCGEKTLSYIICDFLSQVGLSNEDFGNFLAGSMKNTRHQRVFIVPQSGSLCTTTDGETE